MSLFTRIWNALDNFASSIVSLTDSIGVFNGKLRESIQDRKPVELSGNSGELPAPAGEQELIEGAGENGNGHARRRLAKKV